MSIASTVAQEAKEVALDDSHGYDQINRWGNPDYDCSALAIDLYKKAGIPLTATYTGNMKADFLAHGFKDVKNQVNLATGAGLEPGDVLLNEIHHAAIYVGNGQIVHATGNEFGGIKGGQPGDQTGREICIAPYYNYGNGGWDCVLRYEGPESSPETNSGEDSNTYTVKPGDSLWAIATAHNMDYRELARINGIGLHEYIYPGQVLRLKEAQAGDPSPPDDTGTDPDDIYTVKAGDSLWQIAQTQLGSGWKWPMIAAENNLQSPYIIHPGDRLKIPK